VWRKLDFPEWASLLIDNSYIHLNDLEGSGRDKEKGVGTVAGTRQTTDGSLANSANCWPGLPLQVLIFYRRRKGIAFFTPVLFVVVIPFSIRRAKPPLKRNTNTDDSSIPALSILDLTTPHNRTPSRSPIPSSPPLRRPSHRHAWPFKEWSGPVSWSRTFDRPATGNDRRREFGACRGRGRGFRYGAF